MTGSQAWRPIAVLALVLAIGLVSASTGAGVAYAEQRWDQASPASELRASPGAALEAIGSEPVRQWGGRWIDVRLSGPTLVTAYEGGRPVYSAYAIRGLPNWPTPTGTFYIQRRVYNERMVGPGYDVSGVLFTQYFTAAGHSLHYNYWSSNFGGAGSHGCLGMTYADSLWFWNWATVGTPVVIHW